MWPGQGTPLQGPRPVPRGFREQGRQGEAGSGASSMSQGEAVDLVVFVGCRSPDIDLKKLEKVKKVYYCYFFPELFIFFWKAENVLRHVLVSQRRGLWPLHHPSGGRHLRTRQGQRPWGGPRWKFGWDLEATREYILIHLYYIVDILYIYINTSILYCRYIIDIIYMCRYDQICI